jgi:hypothetical protein
VQRRLRRCKPDDAQAVSRALDLGYNVALLGESADTGALLEHLQRERPTAHAVHAAGLESAPAFLWHCARTLSAPTPTETSSSRVALHALRLADAGRGTEMLVDGLDASVAHGVFGTMRDELWELRLRWVCAVGPQDEPIALMPPADAFFHIARRVPSSRVRATGA